VCLKKSFSQCLLKLKSVVRKQVLTQCTALPAPASVAMYQKDSTSFFFPSHSHVYSHVYTRTYVDTHVHALSLLLSHSRKHTHTHAWKHLKRVSVHIWCLRTYIDDLEAAYECTNVLRTDVWNRKKVTYIILKIANFAEPSRFATFRRCKIKYQRWGNNSENVIFLTGFPYWSFLNHKNWLNTSCYLC